MKTHNHQTQENKSSTAANFFSKQQGSNKPALQFIDNRRKNSAQKNTQAGMNNNPQPEQSMPVQVMEKNQTSQTGGPGPVQQNENKTGLPGKLKSGIENLSGMSMDKVRVHYNSSQPVQLHALAYTQGSDIHVAPGQEQHLPHEAWHVVQQAQGRVKPTMQMKNGIAVNNDKGLEREADMMGAKAMQAKSTGNDHAGEGGFQKSVNEKSTGVTQMKPLSDERLNVAGETHDESDPYRDNEKFYSEKEAKGPYWTELEFEYEGNRGDPTELRLIHYLKMMNEQTLNFYQLVKSLNDAQFLEKKEDVARLLVRLLKQVTPEHIVGETSQEEMKGWEEVGTTYTALYGIINDMVVPLSKPGGDKLKPQLEEALADMYQFTYHASKGVKGEAADVRKTRSQIMKKVANMAVDGGKKGLWKVGERHIPDMKEVPGNIKFNILTKEEFQQGFKNFWAEILISLGDDEGKMNK